jgi:hypothetical protein
VWVHVVIPSQPKKRSDGIANCLQNAVCSLLASLKRVSPFIECWSLPQIQCRILLPYWVRVESFQLIESASSYLGCPFPPDVLHVIFVWTQISQTPANIFFAGSVVRLGLVFKYNCKSTFLQQVGWERCPVFNRTLKSGDLPPLKKRLDRGSLRRASASNLGTDICMIRLLSAFFFQCV